MSNSNSTNYITHIRFPNESYYDEITTFKLEEFVLIQEFEDSVFGIWQNIHVFIEREDYEYHKLLENGEK